MVLKVHTNLIRLQSLSHQHSIFCIKDDLTWLLCWSTKFNSIFYPVYTIVGPTGPNMAKWSKI